MAKLYWRVKRNGKWTWKPVECSNCETIPTEFVCDECCYINGGEEEWLFEQRMIGVHAVMLDQDAVVVLGGEYETPQIREAIRTANSEFAGFVLFDVEVFDWSY